MNRLQPLPLTYSPAQPPAAQRVAHPADVKSFLETLDGPSDPLEATDEELARLAPSDLADLRSRFGDDEHGLRVEAKSLLTAMDNFCMSIVQSYFQRAKANKDKSED